MRDNVSRSSDKPRAIRRWSPARYAWCDAELPRELVDAVLRGDPGRVLFSSNPLQVKDRCVVARHDTAIGPLSVKRHAWGGFWRTVRMAFREPAARSCARLGLELHSRGIPTPRPRAYVNFRIGPWTYRSFLINDFVEGESLYRYIRFGSQNPDELRDLATQVARIWQTLVEQGVSHNDFKPENFIVDQNRNVWLIDLEKVRLRGKPAKQRKRQVFDVQNFLHVRGWHNRAEARAIFAEAFLQTPHGDWLRKAGIEQIALLGGPRDKLVDTSLSVLVLCDGDFEMPRMRQAIESVRDIADEVVIADVAATGNPEVLKRINCCEPAADTTAKSAKRAAWSNASAESTAIAHHPWVLILHQDECVTPFLAKELQQRIADHQAVDAFRIPLEKQVFGRTLARRRREVAPVRLLRQAVCSPQILADFASVETNAERTSQLTGTIQKTVYESVAAFVDDHNDSTTFAAEARLQQNEQARFGRAIWRAAAQFAKSYFWNAGVLSGWTGLQIASLEGFFVCVEEAKLQQLHGEFRGASDEDGADPAEGLRIHRERHESLVERKAA